MPDTGRSQSGTTLLTRPTVAGPSGATRSQPRRPPRPARTRLIGLLAIIAIASTPSAGQLASANANAGAAPGGQEAPAGQTNPAAGGAASGALAQETLPKPAARKAAGSGNASTAAVAASPTRFGVNIQAGGSSYSSAFSAANARYGGLETYRKFFSGAPGSLNTGYGNVPVVASFHYAPRDVLSGRHNAALANWFRAAPRQYPTYWVYNHEPEDDIERGQFTAADYKAAWRHIRGIQRSVGRMDLKATLTLMCWTASSGSGRDYRNYYAGSDVIDVMAWDCYNYGRKASEQHYIPADQMFDRVIKLSASLGKPFGIAETASPRLPGDSSGNGRANWLRSIAAYLSQHRAVFVCYFDAQKAGSTDFRLTDSPSRAAWRAIVSA